MSGKQTLYSFENKDVLAKQLRSYLIRRQNEALAHRDTFRVTVSGGSLPDTLAKALIPDGNGTKEDTVEFTKWDIFFADERCVPLEHPDSNYRLLKDDFLSKIPPEKGSPTVHPIDEETVKKEDPQEVADRYQEELTRVFAAKETVKLPLFDVMMLGCGPDGHTCSLFPGHELLREKDSWVAAETNSPKPPPKRITLTLPVVVHATNIIFVTAGEGKSIILKKIFDDEEGASLPSGLVNQGGGEKVSWFADAPAVKGVQFPKQTSLV